jgi:hypothetical protein
VVGADEGTVSPEGNRVVAYNCATDGGAPPSPDAGTDGGCVWLMDNGEAPETGNGFYGRKALSLPACLRVVRARREIARRPIMAE